MVVRANKTRKRKASGKQTKKVDFHPQRVPKVLVVNIPFNGRDVRLQHLEVMRNRLNSIRGKIMLIRNAFSKPDDAIMCENITIELVVPMHRLIAQFNSLLGITNGSTTTTPEANNSSQS